MEPSEHPPEAERPLTREDVLRLIEEHGGPEGLDLSRKNFTTEVDLSRIGLRGANLQAAHLFNVNLQRATLTGANFQGANLRNADLQGAILLNANLQGADLRYADLRGVTLLNANLQGADLWYANLQEAYLRDAKLQGARLALASWREARELENVAWGSYVLGEETAAWFQIAESPYRALKQWHTQHGLPDIAAKFYYREMECRRKALSWRKEPPSKLWRTFLWLFGGYGERPFWILIWWGAVILLASLFMYLLGGAPPSSAQAPLVSAAPGGAQDSLTGFWYAIYYGLVSFTALGYGGWVDEPADLWKFFGVGVSLLGAVLIGIFVVYLARMLIR